MFTGIVEEIGAVTAVEPSGDCAFKSGCFVSSVRTVSMEPSRTARINAV